MICCGVSNVSGCVLIFIMFRAWLLLLQVSLDIMFVLIWKDMTPWTHESGIFLTDNALNICIDFILSQGLSHHKLVVTHCDMCFICFYSNIFDMFAIVMSIHLNRSCIQRVRAHAKSTTICHVELNRTLTNILREWLALRLLTDALKLVKDRERPGVCVGSSFIYHKSELSQYPN